MSRPTLTSDDLERLKRERDEYDRRYNDALTELDRSILRALPEIPHPPPAFDEYQITPLNELWAIVPAGGLALGGGWRGRVRRFVWRLVGPLFEQQQRFNSALVDHINRNVTTARETKKAIDTLIALVAAQLGALLTFESRLVQWAQEITGYVDTKDRDVGGRLQFALTTGLDAVADELQKRWESMVARERRYAARVDEVRSSLAVLHQASATLKRELERLMAAAPAVAPPAPPGVAPPPGVAAPPGAASPPGVAADLQVGRLQVDCPRPGSGPASTLDAYKYVGFEDKFRGTREDIRARLAEYVPDFEGASDVLDVGCGRGEFLDLLREHGIVARGVDLNHEMVEVCRARGLEVAEADALGYLESLPDGALGGLFAAQVVEHLEPTYLIRFLETAYHKLRPGSKIVLETINPACWYAFFESYLRDLTHVRPLHPDTLVYLLVASGFQRTAVRYRAPFPDASKLQPAAVPRASGEGEGRAALAALVEVVNENTRKLNQLLFTYLDYAAIGVRGPGRPESRPLQPDVAVT